MCQVDNTNTFQVPLLDDVVVMEFACLSERERSQLVRLTNHPVKNSTFYHWLYYSEQFGKYAALVVDKGGTIIAWAAASRVGNHTSHYYEIGAFAAPAHRGKGLGRKAVAGLVKHLLTLEEHPLLWYDQNKKRFFESALRLVEGSFTCQEMRYITPPYNIW